jgi:hypothetical protein
MLAYKQDLLHSTLSAQDSEALYLLASRTVIPATRVENKTTRTLHKIYSSVADWGSNCQQILDPAAWIVCATGDLEGCITCCHEGSSGKGICPLLYEQRRNPCRLIAWQRSGFQVCWTTLPRLPPMHPLLLIARGFELKLSLSFPLTMPENVAKESETRSPQHRVLSRKVYIHI